MSNIYYLFSVNHRFFTEISKIFIRDNTFNHYYGLAYAKNSALTQAEFYKNITYISDIIKTADATPIDYAYLKEIEIKYDVNLSEMIHADRHLMRFNKNKRLKIVTILLRTFITELEKYQISIVWSEGVDDFISFFAAIYCKKIGIKFLYLYQSGLGDHLFLSDRMDTGPQQLEQRFAAKKAEIKANPAEFATLTEFLNNYKQKKTQSTYTSSGDLLYKAISFNDIKAYLTYLIGFLQDKNGLYYDKNPLSLLIGRFKRIFNKARYNRFLKKSAVSLDDLKNTDYFIYPLHFHPECATLILGRWLNDQKTIIELISKNLPADVFLVVKEHYHMVGRRSLEFYESLAQFHNVLFVGSHISPYDLLPQARGVITISSTMAMESLLLKKPVISFGDRYYNISNNVFRVKDFTDIRSIILKALNHHFDENDALALFSIALYHAKDFGYFTPTLFDDGCLEQLAKGVGEYANALP